MNSLPSLKSAPIDGSVILMVDDVATNRQLLGTLLRKAGYQVLSAASAHQTMQQLELQIPDLILLDIMMPGTDGYTLCRRLLADPRTQHIPIIFISALTEVQDKVRAFALGGADYIAKPFQIEEVLARVAYQLKNKRLQAELEREKAELRRMNQQLVAAQRQTDAMFISLTGVTPGLVVDGKYRIEEKIGDGGFGVVYRATQLSLERAVAIKIFRPPEQAAKFDSLSRFQLEGVSASRVNHPNAVTIVDSGISAQGIAYLVMELLDGPTLNAELLRQGQLSVARCMQIMIPLCDVLIAAHAAGIVHRDVKPDNIMLHQTGHGEIVKVLDFGIAKLLGYEPRVVSPVKTDGNELVGTPVYMAPERLSGDDYDGRSDVYSVGIVLYEMLAGTAPFNNRDQTYFKVAFNHMHGQPTPLRTYRPDLSEDLAALVLSALTKVPAQRPTAQQLRDRLLGVMAQESQVSGVTRPTAAASAFPSDGSDTSGDSLVPTVIARKKAAEWVAQWNAGESDPLIEFVVKLDQAELS